MKKVIPAEWELKWFLTVEGFGHIIIAGHSMCRDGCPPGGRAP